MRNNNKMNNEKKNNNLFVTGHNRFVKNTSIVRQSLLSRTMREIACHMIVKEYMLQIKLCTHREFIPSLYRVFTSYYQ